MKKNKGIALLLCAGLLCLVLAACSGGQTAETSAAAETAAETMEQLTAEDSSYEAYLGYQFAGQDPWGGELAVTVRNIENDVMEWTFTDTDENFTFYQEVSGTDLKDGAFSVKGTSSEEESVTFEFDGTISLTDGTVTIVFESGHVMEESPEGGASSKNVEALEEGAKTVILHQTEDNS